MAKEMKKSEPKNVVYLWGAGATQAEVSYLGARPVNVLMRDNDQLGEGISTRILGRIGKAKCIPIDEDRGVDIEKLISLLTASGIDHYVSLAEEMRRRYFDEIRKSLSEAQVIGNPQLAIGLFQMHADLHFQRETETLSGFLTTNHDGLLQVASQAVFGGLNLGFPFASKCFSSSELAPPILQLHGSFTWKFAVPIEVEQLKKTSKYAPDTIWIPPTILKESKNFPFNKMMGLAYELLSKKCDVLRVIGCSLTQNDWNILSLIFNAQRHREFVKGTAFRVELIMGHETGEAIKAECSYLRNVTPIGYLSEGQFDQYKEGNIPQDSDMRNAFAYWLSEKTAYHRGRKELSSEATTTGSVRAAEGV